MPAGAQRMVIVDVEEPSTVGGEADGVQRAAALQDRDEDDVITARSLLSCAGSLALGHGL